MRDVTKVRDATHVIFRADAEAHRLIAKREIEH